MTFDAAGHLIAHDFRGLRIWKENAGLAQEPSIVSMPATAPGRWESSEPSLRNGGWRTDGAGEIVRGLALAVEQPDRVQADHGYRPLPGEELPPGAPPPSSSSTSTPKHEASRGAVPGPHAEMARPGRASSRFRSLPWPTGFTSLVMSTGSMIWTLESPDASGPIKAHRLELKERLPDEFTSLALRPDGSLLALGDRTGHVTLLDTVRLKVVGRIELPGEEAQRMLFALAFSPDGNFLAVGSPQGQILIWSVQKPSAPRLSLTLPGQRGLGSIVFDPQGQRLASSSMGLILSSRSGTST